MSSFLRKKEFDSKQLIGVWVLSTPTKETIVHDTIYFKRDKEFETKIVKNTKNKGTYRVVGNRKVKLQSCIHSMDNIYKCRMIKLSWLIESLNNENMEITQTYQSGKRVRLSYQKLKPSSISLF